MLVKLAHTYFVYTHLHSSNYICKHIVHELEKPQSPQSFVEMTQLLLPPKLYFF